ncbi:MAG TPA: sigma-70 family RNA polymerase sigma factor [Bryobacteraceae bacterium]|nr:sigma-70 family RNA polymerase sigma factor [Bryobacteraceae bacterium]
MAARKPAAETPRVEPDERVLVEAAQRDPARFGDLYELHFERVYAFVARRVRDCDIAEDVTAEVFHKALSGLKSFEWHGAPFGAWLMRIAANAVADQSKRAAREVQASEDAPEPCANPDMEAIENRARLFRLVNELPAGQRTVIFQRFVEQRSIREIAQQLGRSEGAVKQLQFRAIQSLRSQMEGANA